MTPMNLRGLSPAPVTAFKKNGDIDFEANVRIAKWLASFKDVTSLVILGHAGEGTFLTECERLDRSHQDERLHGRGTQHDHKRRGVRRKRHDNHVHLLLLLG